MTLVCDAGPIVALNDRNDPDYDAVRAVLTKEPGLLHMPSQVTAEIDYLSAARFGVGGNRRFLEDLAAGRYEVSCLEPIDYELALDVDRRTGGTLGLADISVVILAARMNTTRILTFDHRHFRAIAPLQGGSFTLLPADE